MAYFVVVDSDEWFGQPQGRYDERFGQPQGRYDECFGQPQGRYIMQ